MMRAVPLALCAILAACSDTSPGNPSGAMTPVSFEGAEAKTNAAKLAHGERIATVLSCTSCHGENLTGGDYGQDADGGFIFAPNLTRAVHRLSDKQLRALLTAGVHPTRERFYYMPAKTLQRLSRADMDALVGYLRTLEPTGRDWPVPEEGETTMALVEMGVLETSDDRVQAYRLHTPPEGGNALGRYVASVTCAECHGPALDGEWASAPSLQSAVSRFDEASLAALLSGHGTRGGLMPLIASRNLSALTEGERKALVAYLLSLEVQE